MSSITSNTEEEFTWSAFAQGNDDALKLLYDRYFETLFHFGRKYASDDTVAEDAIQDLFLKLLNNRQTLATPQRVSAYLLTAYRNILIDKLRKLNNTRTMELTDHGFEYEFSLANALEEKEEFARIKERIQHALSELTPRQREVIYLRYHCDFSYEEAAEILGLTEKATYKLMARAIQALREAYPFMLILLETKYFFRNMG